MEEKCSFLYKMEDENLHMSNIFCKFAENLEGLFLYKMEDENLHIPNIFCKFAENLGMSYES